MENERIYQPLEDCSQRRELTTNERDYLESMAPEVRQEGYTCVSGCSDCCSCDGND